jgi:hypothetical protein
VRVGWDFIQRDVPMIIDYMPKGELMVRSTSYTTVESSLDGGQSWQTVPGMLSNMPPKLFDWGDRVVVATTSGIWISEDSGRDWRQIADVGGRAAALVGDELIVANTSGAVTAVGLPDGAIRTMPRLPKGSYHTPQLAASRGALFLTSAAPEMLRLPEGASEWDPIAPAR